ncbi:hypothetical protein NDU88_001366 [Pleurodeles waltl]|uniref:Uncharacterized protein n=1 Tax=Pleurodeles waltl TaxID=8319 RepID=A0AAV7V7K8_PLEWA|nr:hypothetical protein NDU88_001366 [Pleurodeles waltl]
MAPSSRGPVRGPGGLRSRGGPERKKGAQGHRGPHCGMAGGREAPWEHQAAARSGRDAPRCGRPGGPGEGERAGSHRRCPDGESERGPIERSGGAAAGPWVPGDGACLMPLPALNMAPKDRIQGACQGGTAEQHGRRLA